MSDQVELREIISKLTNKEEKQVQFFNRDPLNYVMTQQEDLQYQNQVSHDLHPRVLNLELWQLITDIIFLNDTRSIVFRIVSVRSIL